MEVIKVAVDKLVLDPNNARRHSMKNLEAIRGSLKKFGQQKPVVIDKNNVVIAGNGTLVAARSLGLKELNCVRSELDTFNATAYAIADNRTGELAEWDDQVLSDTVKNLMENGFELDEIGFDAGDLNKIYQELEDDSSLDDEKTPINTEPGAEGDLNRIMLFFSAEDFKLLVPVAEQLLDKYNLTDFSDLFKKLVYDNAKDTDSSET